MFPRLALVNFHKTTTFLAFPLSATMAFSNNSFQDLLPRNEERIVAGGRLINPVTSVTATKRQLAKYHTGSMLSSSRSCHCSMDAPTKQFAEPLFCNFRVSSSPCVVISGYWIGPDFEDGWGFVEASLCRID